jgi:[ribosomal protein S5]-alanine N-acetyltransferase
MKIGTGDALDLFEMDSDPEVHRFIENKPVTSIDQIYDVINLLQIQYKQNGIARWAVIDKISRECVGWAGLKYFTEQVNNHRNFYELGYRFKQKHWGKGYATETSTAIIDYGFKYLNVDTLFAITHAENIASQNVLTKLKFTFIESFDYDGDLTYWFEVQKWPKY